MDRRDFLNATVSGSLMASSLTRVAYAQSDFSSAEARKGSAAFTTTEINVSGNTIFCRRYGHGSPILLIHGFPRTSLMWRFLAPKLAGITP